MIPPLDLGKLNQQLEAWFAALEGIEPTIADPERRLQMRQAMEQVRRGQATVNAEYDNEIASIAQRTQAVETGAAETLAQITALRAVIEKQQTTPPAEPVAEPPLVSGDGELGPTLRTELLNRYAPPAPSEDAIDEGSVASHWTETEAGPRERPAPPRPKDDRISEDSVGRSEWDE